MKTKLIAIILATLATGIFSCETENKIVDPIYEFVSFTGDESINLGEATSSEAGYPMVIQLWAFDPYQEDITVTFDVTASNAQEGVDFTIEPSNTVKIHAGKLVSDTIWIKTINNAVVNDLARSVNVEIKTIDKADVKIGLGITEPTKTAVTLTIVDDECNGSPLCVYNTTLNNTISGGNVKPATAVVDKVASTVTLTGDLMDYDAFSGATLTLTMTPSGAGATTGTATFGEQETGTDSDGYDYKFVEVGTGSYDADAGTISIEYDIYYWSGGWVYWYSATNELSVP